MKSFLVRLDDACPTMDKKKWQRVEDILDKFEIKPMVGVIPNNECDSLKVDPIDPDFWEKCHNWQNKSWTIALHGYNHVYITNQGGIHPVNSKSEFAGVPFKEQKDKLSKGFQILDEKGINADYFFAPAHSFDENTIKALLEVTPIRKISDTFALKPYESHGMKFYPQQVGVFRNVSLPGYWTFCFHPNTMKEKDFLKFEDFINKHQEKFISFDSISEFNSSKTLFDNILSNLYFFIRKLR